MRNRLIIFIILVSLPVFLHAQQPLCGTVTDAVSGKPVPGVSVKAEGLSIVYTDESGNFCLENIPGLPVNLKFTHVAYSSFRLKITQFQEISIELIPVVNLIGDVVITATRVERNTPDIPGKIECINKKALTLLPANNTDDYLRMISGANIDRTSGIFSKSASISLRGVNGAQRVLVLLDGVPMNKADGGAVNWSRIDPDEVQQIEILKGPGSALYGGNALAGTINIITRTDTGKAGGSIKLFGGTYNTMGGKFRLYGSEQKEGKGFYWNAIAGLRRGDGYILYPDSLRDSTDVKTRLSETGIRFRAGFAFSPEQKAEIEYSFWDDIRGDGVQVFDPEGGFTKYTTHTTNLIFHQNDSDLTIHSTAFWQLEQFQQQKESIKYDEFPPYAVSKYSLYTALADKEDFGLWVSATKKTGPRNFLTAGTDLRRGSVDARDVYLTSTDIVKNQGVLTFAALFFQDEFRFLHDKFSLLSGIRFDFITFSNGGFYIEEPTATSGILTLYEGDFEANQWTDLSPKISLSYSLLKNTRVFAGYSHGFRPPTIDDMCRNGNVNKGFKLANPYLEPEKTNQFELGASWQNKNVELSLEVFRIYGSDFMYFVGNGDSVFVGSRLKPIITRENISGIEVNGAELSFRWESGNGFHCIANAGHFHSVITEFDTTGFVATSLEGKFLLEVIPNQFSALIGWSHEGFAASVSGNWNDYQWIDDMNTLKTEPYFMLNARLGYTYRKNWKFTLLAQNIADTRIMDEKGVLNTGRFIIAGIEFMW